MRFAASLLALLALAFAALGCGDSDDSTPIACLEGQVVYEKALADAPDAVLLEGETPISQCFARNQTGGDLTKVGEATIAVATELNAGARQEPGGVANFQLGYLLGAAARGAEESEGIHADLLRRLTVAARYAPGREPLPPEFLATYREGFDAGRAGG